MSKMILVPRKSKKTLADGTYKAATAAMQNAIAEKKYTTCKTVLPIVAPK
jgi:hypothetical protein